MKYLFMLIMLVVAGGGALMGAVAAYRFVNNMTETPKIVTGERVFPMPAGVVARGSEPIIPKEQRDLAARQPNPIKGSPQSIAIGKGHFTTFCVPCHGPEARGGVTGLVAPKFIPTPDLTNAELQKGRTDGYWHGYIVAGGAVMPAYGEALSSAEAWHVVNYLRTLAAK